ncbi:Sporulation domain-containing protein [Thermodesulfobium narugense DSM 14796]|uniref:Sporulation domain-containing protein n=1 Tax=Thermodesulfobium narugense DSM 14796 TaxID=747365 RepID=M1E883_9BACT|nr:SPOR domain-containing protein [Thermodesulfobium narugense]AEE14314.1 Sporulation domain-containing protein [Thermodesulfobium narugense DSM 14796]
MKSKVFYAAIIIFACLLSFFGFYLVGKGFNFLFFNKPHTQITASNENKSVEIQTPPEDRNSDSNINLQQKGYNNGATNSENSKPVSEETSQKTVNESQISNLKNAANLLYKVRVGPFDDEQDSVRMKKDLFKLGYSSILLKANGSYWLQVAALNKKEDALNLVNNLKMKGINAKIISEQ